MCIGAEGEAGTMASSGDPADLASGGLGAVVATPEPGTLFLMISGLAALFVLHARRAYNWLRVSEGGLIRL